MKESKAVYVNRHKIRDDQNIVYQLNTSCDREHTRTNRYDNNYNKNNEFACQFDSKKDTCTCRNIYGRDTVYFSKIPKQVYAYHGSRSFTDIGVGSVKALQRRKVKRVYLPETDDRGVGSSDLSAYTFIRRTKPYKGSFYDHKKTSSKCVGGIIEYNTGCVINEKLSPILNTKSGTTSPKMPEGQKNIEIGSNTVVKNVETVGTQFEIDDKEDIVTPKNEELKLEATSTKISEPTQKYKNSSSIRKLEMKIKEAEKQFSSDSLVQHVHDLEVPSEDKPSSRTSMDPMENKLEREYRRIFATKTKDSKSSCDKPMPEFKSASVLRRRFDALRRGLTKKDDLKKSSFIPKSSQSRESLPSRKDASVTSDPPSLEGRSYSDAKRYAPIQANVIKQERIGINYRNDGERESLQYATEMDSDCQGVRGMFKLWGKKFNLEEDWYNKKQASPVPSYDSPKKSEKEIVKRETEKREVEKKEIEKKEIEVSEKKKPEPETKKEKRFFFFKKKTKDKAKEPYQKPPKKKAENVTAGRCEITDGITLKMGRPSPPASGPKQKISKTTVEEDEEITRKRWLRRFLSNTIESARSVNVRWNNTTYATSSSTLFELIDTVYKNTELFIKSHSEMSSLESYYRSNTNKNKVNFIQDIEAWMIPKTIPDKPKEIPVKIRPKSPKRDVSQKDVELSYFNQKWLIDRTNLSHQIEVVLHSKNSNFKQKVSSEYLRIDIPKDFFDNLSSDESKRNQTSDEEVYKIVEYESDNETKRLKRNIRMEKGDDPQSDIVIVSVKDSKNLKSKIVETVIKRPPTHRDVIIQGSNVNIPKRCDVIGVGIITQRDLREMRKPILKFQDVLSSEDSDPPPLLKQKKCEFAESYLQEYYKHYTPLGLDLYSCVSDSHLKSCSEKSLSFHNQQGDASKSCPNICDDYQASTVISSSDVSSDSAYNKTNENKLKETKGNERTSSKFVNFMKKKEKELDTVKEKDKKEKDADDAGKRFLPKDSLEVFKKRKIYAQSNKSQWNRPDDKPVSVPSFESRGEQDYMDSRGGGGCRSYECPKQQKPIPVCPAPIKKRTCKKHVSMPDCETQAALGMKKQAPEVHGGILTFKGSVGCDFCKKKTTAPPKHATVIGKPSLEIYEPPCKVICIKQSNPSCGQPGSPSCNTPRPPCPKPTVCPGTLKRTTSPPSPRSCPPTPPSGPPTPPKCPPSPPKCPASPPRCPASPPKCPASPPKCPPSPPKCPPSPPKYPPSPPKYPYSPPKCPASPPKCPASPPPCPPKPRHTQRYPSPPPPCPTPKTRSTLRCPSPPRPASPPVCPSPPHRSTPRRLTCPHISPAISTANSCTFPNCQKHSRPPTPKVTQSPLSSGANSPICPICQKPSQPPPKPCPICFPPPKKSIEHPPCPAMKPDCRGNVPSCPSVGPICSSKMPDPPHLPPCPATLPSCQRPSRTIFGLSISKHNSTLKISKKKSSCPRCAAEKPEKSSSKHSCRGCMPKKQKSKKNKKIECCSAPPSCATSASPSTHQASQCPSPKSSNICSKCSQYSHSNSSSSGRSPGSVPSSPNTCEVPTSPIPCDVSTSPVPAAVPIGPGLSLCSMPHPPKPPKPKPPPKLSPCHKPPCSKIETKPNKNDSKKSKQAGCGQEFPWPMNSQCSNQPSPQTSEGCFEKLIDKIKDNKSECNKNCVMMKTTSGCYPDPVPQQKECEPECLNKTKVASPGCGDNQKKSGLTGLFLRKNPSKKKTCAKECPAWDNENAEPGVVRLNSREKITINLKEQTPSTEEIRECLNIKVKDEDGRTLYERKDYTTGNNRSSVCGNIYDAKLNRLSTPVMVTNLASETQQDVSTTKSEQSLSNLVEIQFKLRIIQGDKANEISIGKEEDPEEKNEGILNAPEVYSVKNDERDECDEGNPKNDINIKIIVKNYKPKSEKRKSEKEKQAADDYNNKISHKFNTVSTGYSDIYTEPTDDNVFSVHRATINLTSSTERSKTHSAASNERSKSQSVATNQRSKSHSVERFKTHSNASRERSKTHSAASHERSKTHSAASNERSKIHSTASNARSDTHSAVSNDVDESVEPIEQEPSNTKSKTSYTVPSLSTEELVLITEDEATDYTKSNLQAYDTHYEYLRETYSNYFNKARAMEKLQKVEPEIQTPQKLEPLPVKSEEKIQSHSKENSKLAKKELLKRVFQRAHSKPKSKGRVRQLREMLKIILTDSSTNDDLTMTSNELAKDVTYTSLKPNYFRDTDSMNNYYKMETDISSLKIKTTLLEPNNYPTKENNSDDSEEDSGRASPQYRGCMCSKVVEKIKDPSLNISCCCKRKSKQDGEVNCDLYDDCRLSIDAETQKSTILNKVISNKSTNIPGMIVSKIKEFTSSKFTNKQSSKAMLDYELNNKTHNNIVLMNHESKRTDRRKKYNYSNAADILQCYEAKKAVLEIYAEKAYSEQGEHLVAKLPKFLYEKESEIERNYDKIATNSYVSVRTKNVLMMSVGR